MLQGYTVLLLPVSKADLVAAPPWHDSGDVIALEFWTDPAAASVMLPQGAGPDPTSVGHELGMFVGWQFTAQDDGPLLASRHDAARGAARTSTRWRPFARCR